MKKIFYGKYAGQVFDNNDPKKLGRIKALVEEVGFVSEPTDWAWPCVSPYGGIKDTGSIWVPEIGMNVWIEFESGDVNKPIWSGVYWSEPGGKSEIPELAKGIPDESTRIPKELDQAETGSGKIFNEPPSAFAAKYPYNKVMKTKSGHIIEIDDTPGQERIHIYHKSGTYKEIKRDGSLTEKVIGKLHSVVIGDVVLHYNNKVYIVVEGDIEETNYRTKTVYLKQGLNEIVDGPITREYSSDETITIKGKRRINYKGGIEENFSGSISKSIIGSEAKVIGGAKDTMILETERKQIGNASGQNIAKSVDILLGDYVLNLISGNQKIELKLGDFILNLLTGKIDLKTQVGNILIETSTGNIQLNGGNTLFDGVVTKSCMCPFLGSPHIDGSIRVLAKKM
ncbi:MAG: phage baseplate assembly protein V [Elusimicrobiota bacterium]